MTLVLAGGGLEPGHMTLSLLEWMGRADVVYVDSYTMPSSEWLVEEARRRSKGRVVEAGRRVLEEGSRAIIEEARYKVVLVLSPGDPLIATTHISLAAEASSSGVEVVYLPGVSGVSSAMAVSGLSFYKFGRVVTVPHPSKVRRPYSVVLSAHSNLCLGLHTLALLDVTSRGQMSPQEAASILESTELEASREAGYRPVVDRAPVMVVERAGTGSSSVHHFRSLGDLAASRVGFREPSSLIIPGEVSRVESENVHRLWGHRLPVGPPMEESCRARERLQSWLHSGP